MPKEKNVDPAPYISGLLIAFIFGILVGVPIAKYEATHPESYRCQIMFADSAWVEGEKIGKRCTELGGVPVRGEHGADCRWPPQS